MSTVSLKTNIFFFSLSKHWTMNNVLILSRNIKNKSVWFLNKEGIWKYIFKFASSLSYATPVCMRVCVHVREPAHVFVSEVLIEMFLAVDVPQLTFAFPKFLKQRWVGLPFSWLMSNWLHYWKSSYNGILLKLWSIGKNAETTKGTSVTGDRHRRSLLLIHGLELKVHSAKSH